MFDTSTFPQFATPGIFGHQFGLYGSPQLGQQAHFGQSQLPGFVPIVSLVPQSLLVTLVAQSLQQAQQGMGHVSGPFGQSPFGPPIGQSPYWQSPWQTTGAWGGQSPYPGVFGRGVPGYQGVPQMSYNG